MSTETDHAPVGIIDDRDTLLTSLRTGDVAATLTPIDFGVLTTDASRVVAFTEKPSIDYRVSMGVYGVSRATLDGYTPGLPLGFDELVTDLLAAGRPPHAYEFDGYWLDIGRPDDYDRANAEFTSRKSLLLKGA